MKESFHCIHRTQWFVGDFKIMCVLFNCQLSVVAASREVSQDAGWKLMTLLCCRRHFSVSQLMFLYKAHILTFIESRTSALHHAVPNDLNTLDCAQRRFLREVNMSKLKVFRTFSLAPLPVQRNISMLCIIDKVAHGLTPYALSNFFPR